MAIDRDSNNRCYRVVGSLDSVCAALKAAPVMPDDRATARLLKSAEALMKQALDSALEYAIIRNSESDDEVNQNGD